MFNDEISAPQRDIYTISRLNREVRGMLEHNFPLIWVEGEISNLARPSSGHWYFSLKDSNAQVRCAMFRNRNQLLRFRPENGTQVLIRARVSLYEGRGDYQLIAEHMEEAGDGALLRAFEELKQKLSSEGLFAEQLKQAPPDFPRCIGIVTSPTGAAIRDILSVLKRRFPAIPVIIYPSAVQGAQAGKEIARAIQIADQRQDCDVLIVARGGGSLEDLWAFNEEVVARAIHDCNLPVVSGIGHEIDFTIADFVADRRAPTPSAAAELLSPDQAEWKAGLRNTLSKLQRTMQIRISQDNQKLAWVKRRLQQQHPGVRLKQLAQRLDELEQRLHRARQAYHDRYHARLQHLAVRLRQHIPTHRLQQYSDRLKNLSIRQQQSITRILDDKKQSLASLCRAMDAVSPLATLDRGYSILKTPDGIVVRSSEQVQTGDTIKAQLSKGTLLCRVEEKSES
jgi:exodeoxyribonuclease VII large subunit